MQKITNEEIAKPTYWTREDQWGIRVCSDFGDLAFFKNDRDAAERVLSALNRLEDLEAKEHERRWRKIADEGLPLRGELSQFTDGREIIATNKHSETEPYTDFTRKFDGFETATHWRPQETDLPEAI